MTIEKLTDEDRFWIQRFHGCSHIDKALRIIDGQAAAIERVRALCAPLPHVGKPETVSVRCLENALDGAGASGVGQRAKWPASYLATLDGIERERDAALARAEELEAELSGREERYVAAQEQRNEALACVKELEEANDAECDAWKAKCEAAERKLVEQLEGPQGAVAQIAGSVATQRRKAERWKGKALAAESEAASLRAELKTAIEWNDTLRAEVERLRAEAKTVHGANDDLVNRHLATNAPTQHVAAPGALMQAAAKETE